MENENIQQKKMAQMAEIKLRWNFAQSHVETFETWKKSQTQNSTMGDLQQSSGIQDMWLELEPSDLEFPKSHSMKSQINLFNKSMVAVSKRGRSHAHEGKYREDHFEISTLEENQWWIMVVADGAGSAKYAREGSRIACEEGMRNLKNFLNDIENGFGKEVDELVGEGKDLNDKRLGLRMYKTLAGCAHQTLVKIFETAAERQHQLRYYNTTFLCTAVRACNEGYLIVSFWIGDGAIGLIADDKFELLGDADTGEQAGQTLFLTSASALKDGSSIQSRCRIRYVQKLDGLILMTDGVSDPKFQASNDLISKEKWTELWNEIQPKIQAEDDGEALLKWLDFYEPKFHDDRTIAILY